MLTNFEIALLFFCSDLPFSALLWTVLCSVLVTLLWERRQQNAPKIITCLSEPHIKKLRPANNNISLKNHPACPARSARSPPPRVPRAFPLIMSQGPNPTPTPTATPGIHPAFGGSDSNSVSSVSTPGCPNGFFKAPEPKISCAAAGYCKHPGGIIIEQSFHHCNNCGKKIHCELFCADYLSKVEINLDSCLYSRKLVNLLEEGVVEKSRILICYYC